MKVLLYVAQNNWRITFLNNPGEMLEMLNEKPRYHK